MKYLFVILSMFVVITALSAHGLNYEVLTRGIAIKADAGGKAFSGADVTVYSPDNYVDPVWTAKTDSNGIYYFNPDKPGDWVIFLRDDAGHGARVNLTIDKNLQLKGSGTGNRFTIFQIILMSFCVIFGIVGTGLFFMRKR